jgi:hypothetical protein
MAECNLEARSPFLSATQSLMDAGKQIRAFSFDCSNEWLLTAPSLNGFDTARAKF